MAMAVPVGVAMSGDDVLIGLLLWLVLLGSTGSAATMPLPRLAWTWPLPTLFFEAIGKTYPAVVSNEYQGKHIGQDICYRRDASNFTRAKYPPGTHEGTREFFCPAGTPVLAAAQGQVRAVQPAKTGLAVILDHGDGWETWYLHLEQVAVKPGDVVAAGQGLGVVGWDPQDPEGFRHLHFAIRYRGQPVLPTGQDKWRRQVWKR
jgi:murein DD-endopeptidase MepM/ murein hydrolase activator NlpD